MAVRDAAVILFFWTLFLHRYWFKYTCVCQHLLFFREKNSNKKNTAKQMHQIQKKDRGSEGKKVQLALGRARVEICAEMSPR